MTSPGPWLFTVFALIAVCLLVYLAYLVHRAQKEAATDPPEPPPTEGDPDATEPAQDTASSVDLAKVFRRAMRRLRLHLPRHRSQYALPWIVLLGGESSRPPELLADTGLPLPFGPPEDLSIGDERCNFWFFNEGLVIDLGGSYMAQGAADKQEGWEKFLRLLQHHRPERPIDSVVLTVDASRLNRANEGGAGDIERQAATFYRRLWQMQQNLGIRLSVSVLVTGCDGLPGFDAFVEGIPESMRGELLGWSSPYGVEQPYQSEWASQAFEQIDERLRQARSAILAQPNPHPDADGVFMLPIALRRLESPLSAILEQVLRPSAYHDPMMLRGVYFTGRGQAGPEGSRRSHFLSDLLQAKLFPEGDLAAPTEKVAWTRNRRVRVLQATLVVVAVVLGFGSLTAFNRLQRNQPPLAHFLSETEKDITALRQGQFSVEQLQRSSLRLIRDLTRINLSTYSSIFLPSSWLSPVRSDLQTAIADSYDDIIFVAMHDELHRKLEALIAEVRPQKAFRIDSTTGGPRADLPVPAVHELPEFGALRQLAQGLGALEIQAHFYENLPNNQRLDHFANLVDYLFDERVPEDFFEHAGLYQSALERVTPQRFEPASFADNVSPEAVDAADRLFRRLIREAELGAHLEQLSDSLQNLVRWGWGGQQESEQLRAVVDTMNRVEVALSRTEAKWAFGQRFELGVEFNQIIAQLRESAFVDDESVDFILRRGETDWRAFRQQLTSYRSDLTGAFLATHAGEPLMQFSNETLLLKATLESFLSQSFVELDPPVRFREDIPDGQRLRWNTQVLAQAVALRPSYDRFVNQRLGHFPDELRIGLETVARNRLDDRISGMLHRAQRYDAVAEGSTPLFLERRLADDVAAFQAASDLLASLMATFQDLGLWESHQRLGGLIARQAAGLLVEVDHLLTDERLYRPRGGDFSWWHGSSNPMLDGFEAADQEELTAYLDIQRDRIRQLAQDSAKPLVLWLGEDGIRRVPGQRSLVLKWDRILRQLDGHEKGQAGNSITALDTSVLEGMSAVRLTTCDALTALPDSSAAGDFFVARRDGLRRALIDRCHELADVRAAAEYRRLARFFDRRLAGRYPFAEEVPEPFAEEADPEDLRAFFERFDRHLPLLRSVRAESGAFGDALPSVHHFLERMASVRIFFASFLDPTEEGAEPPAEPAFDLEPTFRVNRTRELAGNQIVRWQLEVGDAAVTPRSESRKLRWGPGDRIRLTVDWAQDSPRLPILPLPRHGVRLVGERRLTYETDSLWSALAFIDAHRSQPSALPSFVDIRPHTLRFDAQTWQAPDPEDEDARPPEDAWGESVRFFVRLAVMAPDATEPLELPNFPAAAPRLTAPAPAEAAEVSP